MLMINRENIKLHVDHN